MNRPPHREGRTAAFTLIEILVVIVVIAVILLLFGRGKISELMGDVAQGMARALAAAGVSDVAVANRTQARAVELAAKVGISPSPCLRRVKMLEREGFIVHDAVDGIAALEAIDRHAPELVVLDLNLPDGRGLDLVGVHGEAVRDVGGDERDAHQVALAHFDPRRREGELLGVDHEVAPQLRGR